MISAVDYYRTPMESIANWASAGRLAARAAQYVHYAELLSSRPAEATHVEQPGELSIEVAGKLNGRLCSGDISMPSTLDASPDNGFHDRYSFKVAIPTRVKVTLSCTPCVPRLTIATTTNEVRGSNLGNDGPASVLLDASPATAYYIWAGARRGDVGLYELAVTIVR